MAESLTNYDLSKETSVRRYRSKKEIKQAMFNDYGPIIVGACGLGMFVFPAIAWPLFILACVFFYFTNKAKDNWPMSVPCWEYESSPMSRVMYSAFGFNTATGKKIAKALHIKDAYKKGDGILIIGQCQKTKKLIIASKDLLTRHLALFGTTGSGKTQTILPMIGQMAAMGSGAIFGDGKADPVTLLYLYRILRATGRENDLMVVNFITAGNTTIGKRANKTSNTHNIFAQGSADSLMEVISALMGETGGNDGMWRGRAEAMISAVLRALVELRDTQGLLLNISVLRAYFNLEKIDGLTEDARLTQDTRDLLKAFLNELPGWNEAKRGNNNAKAKADEQFGYLSMQATKVASLLSSTYGHIMNVDVSEVDWADVINSRRIVYVMLPSLEKSPESLKNLGRMIVSGIRGALVSAMGGSIVSGTKEEIAESRPTNAEIPFLVVLDEYSSYPSVGMGDAIAQARSLGVSFLIASQEASALKEALKAEAERILANTGIKMFMKTESPETADMAVRRAGKGMRLQNTKVERKVDFMGNATYKHDDDSHLQEADRLDTTTLTDMKSGEMYITYNGDLIHAMALYGDFKKADHVQINTMIKLYRPNLNAIRAHKIEAEVLDEVKHDLQERYAKFVVTNDAAITLEAEDVSRIAQTAEAVKRALNLDPKDDAHTYGPRILNALSANNSRPAPAPAGNVYDLFGGGAEPAKPPVAAFGNDLRSPIADEIEETIAREKVETKAPIVRAIQEGRVQVRPSDTLNPTEFMSLLSRGIDEVEKAKNIRYPMTPNKIEKNILRGEIFAMANAFDQNTAINRGRGPGVAKAVGEPAQFGDDISQLSGASVLDALTSEDDHERVKRELGIFDASDWEEDEGDSNE